MPSLWRVENFSRGIHTKPARVDGGELYAADIENLQVDTDGFLKLRADFGDASTPLDMSEITGVAATTDYLFLLRADGTLWLQHIVSPSLTTARLILGIGNDLSGRISIVTPAATYIILTSEGDDQGYWIDLRDDSFGEAHPLGLTPPDRKNDLTVTEEAADREGFSGRGYLGYAFTWLRDTLGEPFHGMESNSSGGEVVTQELDDEVQITHLDILSVNSGSRNRKIVIDVLNRPEDAQITHLAIYRTDGLISDRSEIYKSPLRRIGTIPKGETRFEDTNEAEWEKQPLLNNYNDRMPLGVKSIHYHQGRIFAPTGDRLVFTGYDGTIPEFWTFPPNNFVRHVNSGRVDFCVSHREVLLFGGADGLFRLTGRDVYDFEADQISAAGPLDGYSWGVMKDTLGFLGNRGLYLTDASSVEFVSDEALDGFFDAQVVEHGSVVFLQDNAILFFVSLRPVGKPEITDYIFAFDDRHWVRWSGERVGQIAVLGGKFYAGGGSILQEIEWYAGESTDPNLAWAWESNFIHGQESGAGNLTKRFAELLLSAAEGTQITLKTWIDNQKRPTEREIITRDDFYFQRIPIERIGKRLRFRLEGKGPVEIRGMQIEGE